MTSLMLFLAQRHQCGVMVAAIEDADLVRDRRR